MAKSNKRVLMLLGQHDTFRRTVQVGKETRLLVFPAGQPVELNSAEFEAIKIEIGSRLYCCEQHSGQYRPSQALTDEVVLEYVEDQLNKKEGAPKFKKWHLDMLESCQVIAEPEVATGPEAEEKAE